MSCRPARSALAALAVVFGGMVALSGCGGSRGAARPSVIVVVRQAAQPVAVPISLQLELPLIGLSSAAQVSYTTGTRTATLRGLVQPSSTTVYMLDDDGKRVVVNPGSNGRFAVQAKLRPGVNDFVFTAARLGSHSKSATAAVSFQGPAADALSRAIAADPVKYLPPASAGINRKLPPIDNPPSIASGAQELTFTVDPIAASAPPGSGGPGHWLGGFELTEYYPTLEAWFSGALVDTPGLADRHRIDWLYSARGLSMEGDGIGLDGRQYHIASNGAGGWITASGSGAAQFGGGGNAPAWRTGGYWKTSSGGLTYPLGSGGWAAGVGVRYVPPPAGIAFAPGPSRPLAYLRSIAVDPRVIPMGSHVYIPSYASVNGGWFEADDTGGAIIGRHIDVFRPPPSNPADTGNFATGERVYVVPPGVGLS